MRMIFGLVVVSVALLVFGYFAIDASQPKLEVKIVETGLGIFGSIHQVHFQSLDDRTLTIEKILINNQNIDLSDWAPHETQDQNFEYVEKPAPPILPAMPAPPDPVMAQRSAEQCALERQYSRSARCRTLDEDYQMVRAQFEQAGERTTAAYNRRLAEYNALPPSRKIKSFSKMTDDLRQMNIGDKRSINTEKNIVKIEIVTNHGNWVGGKQ